MSSADTNVAEESTVVTTNQRPSIGSLLKTGWKYKHLLPVAASATVKHYISGPPVPSWPLQTTLFTSLMRHTSSNQPIRDPSLAPLDPITSIQSLRKAIAFEDMVPEPKNGFSVDIEIKIKSRGYGGILENVDKDEITRGGDRFVEAKWVVANEVYLEEKQSERVVLYFHGGGYILMSNKSHLPITIMVSKALNCRLLSVNYRLAPETIFPGSLHDAVSAYSYLVDDLKIPSSNIIIAGDSAGGGLSMSLLLYLRDMKMSLPGGMLLLSPWVDPTSSLNTWKTNAETDYLTLANPNQPTSMHPIHLYLGKDYDKYVTHPYLLSSLASYHSLSLPTTNSQNTSRRPMKILIQTGSSEVLLDESSLLYKSLLTTSKYTLRAGEGEGGEELGGVEVDYQIFEGGIHVAAGFLGTAISSGTFEAMKLWGLESSIGIEVKGEEEWKGEGRDLVEGLLRSEAEKREKAGKLRKKKDGHDGTTTKKQLEKKKLELEKKLHYEYIPIEFILPTIIVREDGNEFVKLGVERVESLWNTITSSSSSSSSGGGGGEGRVAGGRVRLFEARKIVLNGKGIEGFVERVKGGLHL